MRPKLEPMVDYAWDATNYADYMIDLVLRWLERELAQTYGKAANMEGDGSYLPPGILPTPGHSLDDVGAAIRANNVTETDQLLIITSAAGRCNEWESLMKRLKLSRVDFKESLRIAWLKLSINLYARGMIRHPCE